ncbi:MAG: hypothetical protein HYT97_06030 [Elusimicrobia bacterium]|nr:hypothetical protein [Elusimicrobiota bacterium]
MKRISKKQCDFCHCTFLPDARAWRQQRTCFKESCRKKRKAKAQLKWFLRHPDYHESRKIKIKNWAKDYPDYWKFWRKRHPEYVERDNLRRQQSYQNLKITAKQNETIKIFEQPEGTTLQVLQEFSAKQNLIYRRLESLFNVLSQKEFPAK